MWIHTKSWVNGAMDNGSNCLLVQKVAGTEQIGLSHSKFAWLTVQEILDNVSILFLFSTSKIQIEAVIRGCIFIIQLIIMLLRFQKTDHVKMFKMSLI